MLLGGPTEGGPEAGSVHVPECDEREQAHKEDMGPFRRQEGDCHWENDLGLVTDKILWAPLASVTVSHQNNNCGCSKNKCGP